MPFDLPSWLTPGTALALAVGGLVLLLIAVRAVLLLRRGATGFHDRANSPFPPDPKTVAAPGLPGTFAASTIVVDGRAYTGTDQIPPEAQKTLDKLQILLVDADRDGIPDAFEKGGLGAVLGVLGNGAVQVQTIDLTPEGQARFRTAERLQELKSLLDRGLITAADYEAKKREILAGL